MKSVFKPLSFVAMAITFTMSALALAETTAPAATAADTSTQPAKPVVHHHKHTVKDASKAADAATPATAEKAAPSTAAEPAKAK